MLTLKIFAGGGMYTSKPHKIFVMIFFFLFFFSTKIRNLQYFLFNPSLQCIGFGSIFPSRFQKLARLNFKVNKSNWHVLQALLVVAPDLEVLVLDKVSYGNHIYVVN